MILGSQLLQANKHVLRIARTDKFIELRLKGGAIPVLGGLDQEDHEECNNAL